MELFKSKTFWVGLLGCAADAIATGGALHWQVLASALLAFGARSLGAHLNGKS